VHELYASILEPELGFALPTTDAARSDGELEATAESLRRWLRLFDMAITPTMLREATNRPDGEVPGVALLRYYVTEASAQASMRDKLDLVAGYLYRVPPGGGLRANLQGGISCKRIVNPHAIMEFETELSELLRGLPLPAVPDEHRQLSREFPFLAEEVEDFSHFDELMDSGVMKRARDIKQSFGSSIYHPAIVAAVGTYNAYFRLRFDQLFREAVAQIKSFADQVQQQGASVLSRVEDDVLVKQLVDVKENEILAEEYSRAQDRLREISRYKKVADKKRRAMPSRPGGIPVGNGPAGAAPAPEGSPKAIESDFVVLADAAPVRRMAFTQEQAKLKTMVGNIYAFIKASDLASGPRRLTMPLPVGTSVVLPENEVDAFRSGHVGEKSFRGELADALCQLAGLRARLTSEETEYHKKKRSEYLWKLHADAMAVLVQIATEVMASLETGLLPQMQQRGLQEKHRGVEESLELLRTQLSRTTALLTSVGAPQS
jgi:hypothetical protein